MVEVFLTCFCVFLQEICMFEGDRLELILIMFLVRNKKIIKKAIQITEKKDAQSSENSVFGTYPVIMSFFLMWSNLWKKDSSDHYPTKK